MVQTKATEADSNYEMETDTRIARSRGEEEEQKTLLQYTEDGTARNAESKERADKTEKTTTVISPGPPPPVSVQYISNPSFTRPVSRLHPGPRPAHLRRACPVGTCVFTAGTRHRQGAGEGKPGETGVGVGAVVKTWVFTFYVFTLRTISAPPPFTWYLFTMYFFHVYRHGLSDSGTISQAIWVSAAAGQPKKIVTKFFFIYPYFYSKCIYCICRNIFPNDSKHMDFKKLLLLSKIQGFF